MTLSTVPVASSISISSTHLQNAKVTHNLETESCILLFLFGQNFILYLFLFIDLSIPFCFDFKLRWFGCWEYHERGNRCRGLLFEKE